MSDAARQQDPDPVILDMMDVKKAYPNRSRNDMEKSLELVGVPPRMRNIFVQAGFPTVICNFARLQGRVPSSTY